MPMSAAMVEKRRLELRAVSLHLFQKRKPLSCRDDVFSRLAWLITMERAKSFVSTLFLFYKVIELTLEYIESDEYVEVTPESTRIRKKYLTDNERKRNKQA